jgi:hypothetical protein
MFGFCYQIQRKYVESIENFFLLKLREFFKSTRYHYSPPASSLPRTWLRGHNSACKMCLIRGLMDQIDAKETKMFSEIKSFSLFEV